MKPKCLLAISLTIGFSTICRIGDAQAALPHCAGSAINFSPPKSSQIEQNRFDWEQRQRNIEERQKTLNPAYYGLLELGSEFDSFGRRHRFEQLDDNASFRESVYSSSLQDLKQMLASDLFRYEINTFNRWLSNFNGLSPEFSDPFFITEQWDWNADTKGLYEIGRFSEWALDGWTAQTRLGLAYGDVSKLFETLERRIALQKALAVDGIDTLLRQLYRMYGQTMFVARTVRQLTPKQCTRLIELSKECLTANDYWRSGMQRSQFRDVKASILLILNSKQGQDNRNIHGVNGELDSEAHLMEKTEEAEQRQWVATDFVFHQPLAPSIFERMLVMESTIRDRYSMLAQLLINPFLILPKSIKPSEEADSDTPEPSSDINLSSACSNNEFGSIKSLLAINAISWRMVIIHTSIRKFQWEHDRLPYRLSELNLSEYTINPSTQKPFHYTITSTGYELTGDVILREEGNADSEIPNNTLDLLTGLIIDNLPYE